MTCQSVLKHLAAARTDLGAGTHLGATARTIEDQFHATGRTDRIFLAHGRATVRAQGLTARTAASLVRFHLGTTGRASMAEIETALGTARHLGFQFGATVRAAQLQVGAAGAADGIVFTHGRAARWTEGLVATGTIDQAQSHISTAPGAGPGHVESAVGAVDFVIL